MSYKNLRHSLFTALRFKGDTMRELTLHIGAHKTGTSTIQSWMFNNKQFLEKKGITPFFIEKGKSKVQVNQTYYFDHSQIAKGIVTIDDQLAINLGKAPGNRVVISSECFSWINDPKEIQKFKAAVQPYFSSIKVLVYIRRQDRQALSHYQQRAKSWEAEGIYFTGDNKSFPTLDKNAYSYLDYYQHFTMWGDIFGDENITFNIFDRKLLKYNCVVSDFLDYLNVSFQKGSLTIKDTNTSLGILNVKVAHILREMGVKRESLVFQKIIKELGDSYVIKPSRKEALHFYSVFKESNVALNKRFGIDIDNEDIFSDDFAFYPEVATEDWTEELANHAIKTILNVLLNK